MRARQEAASAGCRRSPQGSEDPKRRVTEEGGSLDFSSLLSVASLPSAPCLLRSGRLRTSLFRLLHALSRRPRLSAVILVLPAAFRSLRLAARVLKGAFRAVGVPNAPFRAWAGRLGRCGDVGGVARWGCGYRKLLSGRMNQKLAQAKRSALRRGRSRGAKSRHLTEGVRVNGAMPERGRTSGQRNVRQTHDEETRSAKCGRSATKVGRGAEARSVAGDASVGADGRRRRSARETPKGPRAAGLRA
jgi:hypothetical protein